MSQRANVTQSAPCTADGSVFTWGGGECGTLGLGGDLSDKRVPTHVTGELQNEAVLVVQVATGTEHSMCVTRDGSVYMWGYNYQGQLGVVGVNDAGRPVLVQAFDSSMHNCVVCNTCHNQKQRCSMTHSIR